MTKLELLYAQKTKKFDEICALVARELGYDELSTMNGEGRNQIEDEAQQYVKQWEETVEMRTSPTIRPITPLRRLLNQYHDICERILDQRAIEEGSGLTREEPGVGVCRRLFNKQTRLRDSRGVGFGRRPFHFVKRVGLAFYPRCAPGFILGAA